MLCSTASIYWYNPALERFFLAVGNSVQIYYLVLMHCKISEGSELLVRFSVRCISVATFSSRCIRQFYPEQEEKKKHLDPCSFHLFFSPCITHTVSHCILLCILDLVVALSHCSVDDFLWLWWYVSWSGLKYINNSTACHDILYK